MNTAEPTHISTVPQQEPQGSNRVTYEPDGVCHCDPQPASTAAGECPRCHRLDLRTVRP